MSLSSLSRYRTQLLVALSLALTILFVPLAKNLARIDPWSAFERENYLDPFGPGIGSVMQDVDVSAYDGFSKSASFNVGKVELRRDQQFMRLTNLNHGVLYSNNKPVAQFTAELANYDVKKGFAEASGKSTFSNNDFQLSVTNLTVDRKRELVSAANGVAGKYRGGDLKAASFNFEYGKSHAVLKDASWSGPAEAFTQEKGQQRKLDIRVKTMETFTNPDREVYEDAELHEADSIMRAEKMTWDKEKDIVTAEGSVEYYGPDAVMIAPKVVVYRKEKRAVATGDVHMLVKPEEDKGGADKAPLIPPALPILPQGLKQPTSTDQQTEKEVRDPKTGRKYPITITCTKVEYFYAKGKKRAILTGSPHARQELKAGAWREVFAPTAIYEEDKEVLTLKSSEGGRDVRLKNSNGDSFVAETIEVSTVQGQEKLKAFHMEGTMMVRDEEEDSGGKPPPKPTGGG